MSTKLQSIFIDIMDGCFPVQSSHLFRIRFYASFGRKFITDKMSLIVKGLQFKHQKNNYGIKFHLVLENVGLYSQIVDYIWNQLFGRKN